MSVEISLTNHSKKYLRAREKPFNKTIADFSTEKKLIHKNDIMRLEDKIKKLDREIKETEKMRNEVHRSNSMSTHETEIDSENSYLLNPYPERKSMPIKNTLGHIRGIITHMVDLVNQDPLADTELNSELSNLVKQKYSFKDSQDTPSALKSINSIAEETPQMLELAQSFNSYPKKIRKMRSKSKIDTKRTENMYPKRRKVWKEDLEYYSNYSKNSLLGHSFTYKRQKTIERDNYLSISE
eukprot:CAMPEP_0205812932 /NCGR_PEP_ID=MMETSP0205-20121125/17547_1 /ASSEMBLY_ACC=CAM_ASM_000278 /TAXON_ID=36767 /ORGANISM="Euplotes focardii, Strain TN1" /LENGTH=239 /DNA_ID=CAMNT_0053094427 /DNA_START=183 /DNA_END=902 /DNA_ORIENTATION=+